MRRFTDIILIVTVAGLLVLLATTWCGIILDREHEAFKEGVRTGALAVGDSIREGEWPTTMRRIQIRAWQMKREQDAYR